MTSEALRDRSGAVRPGDRPESPPAVEAVGLTREFRGRSVVRNVSLRVNPGQTVVVYGPNGAGKTTLLRMLSTLLRPTSGQVLIAGLDAFAKGEAVRRRIGVVGHQTMLYDDLTATENLSFYGRMYDVPAVDRRIAEVIELVGLANRRNDRVREFSRGMQQRLALARAILHAPALLLLDEPESGLDPQAAAGLRSILAAIDRPDRAVILTSHDLDLGLQLADRIVIMANGRIAFDASSGELDRVSLDAAYLVAAGAKR